MKGIYLEVKNIDILKSSLNENLSKDVKLKVLFINSFLKNNNDLQFTCELFHTSTRSGYEWIYNWNKNGILGLKDKPITGRKAKLTENHIEELMLKLQEKDFWDISEIQELIIKLFNIVISNGALSKVLRKRKMNYTKPYRKDFRRPDNADELLVTALQEAFVQIEEDGLNKEDIVIGFMDEASPQNKANSGRAWSFGSPIMKVNTTKYKANTIAFYALNGNDAIMFLEDSKKETICEFIKEIRNKNPNPEAIIVVLDNFSSHKTKLCRDTAKDNGIYLVFLPPYSPDLNPIEFIWKSVRRMISKFFLKSKGFLEDIIVTSFEMYAKSMSFAEGWIRKITPFISDLNFLNEP